MRIPKVISSNNREYILVKAYGRYALYKDMITGVKECFTYHELGLIKDRHDYKNLKKQAKFIIPKT